MDAVGSNANSGRPNRGFSARSSAVDRFLPLVTGGFGASENAR